MHGDVLAYLFPGDDLFPQHSGRPSLKLVVPLLLLSLVRLDVISQQRGLFFGNDTDVDVRTGTEVVEDTSQDGIRSQLDCFLPRQFGLPLSLKHRHGRQRSAAHGDVRELVCTSMGVDGKETNSRGVNSSDNEIRADVSLISEEMLFEHRHARHHSRLASGGEGMELQLRGDEGGGKLGVRSRSGSSTPYLRRDVM